MQFHRWLHDVSYHYVGQNASGVVRKFILKISHYCATCVQPQNCEASGALGNCVQSQRSFSAIEIQTTAKIAFCFVFPPSWLSPQITGIQVPLLPLLTCTLNHVFKADTQSGMTQLKMFPHTMTQVSRTHAHFPFSLSFTYDLSLKVDKDLLLSHLSG